MLQKDTTLLNWKLENCFSDADYRLGPIKCGSLHMEDTDFFMCIQVCKCEHMKSDIISTVTIYNGGLWVCEI